MPSTRIMKVIDIIWHGKLWQSWWSADMDSHYISGTQYLIWIEHFFWSHYLINACVVQPMSHWCESWWGQFFDTLITKDTHSLWKSYSGLCFQQLWVVQKVNKVKHKSDSDFKSMKFIVPFFSSPELKA